MHTTIAIVTTHPIQYNAPWFKLLNKEQDITVKVFYTWSQAEKTVEDKVFGRKIIWDIPLLTGYDYKFVNNISDKPGSHHRNGIICPTLISEIKDNNPNVILVFGWYLKSHFDVMKYFHNKRPIWFRGDSTLLDNSNYFKKILRKIYLKYVYTKVDTAFYVGTNNKNYFLEYGLRERDLVFANHAIDNERFFDDEFNTYQKKADKWKEELGFKDEETVILFSGKFQEKKQPDFLIRAVKNVNKKNHNKFKLILVGQGPQESMLKTIIGEDKNIMILPFQNQSVMPIVYRLCDIYCLPSKGPGETWGLAVNEAMACSRPVIVSDRVGCALDLVNNSNGFVFSHQKIEQLEQILMGLNEYDLKCLGKRSQQIIENWNYSNIVLSIKNTISIIKSDNCNSNVI